MTVDQHLASNGCILSVSSFMENSDWRCVLVCLLVKTDYEDSVLETQLPLNSLTLKYCFFGD